MSKSLIKSLKIEKILLYLILIAVSVTMIYPFLWTISASFKTTTQLFSGRPLDLIPNPIRVQNYKDAWNFVPFGRFLINTLLIALTVVSFQILFASMAGYAFARLRFRGKNIVFIMLLGTMMIPGHVTLIPNYVLMRYFHWIDKYQALIVPAIFNGTCVTGMFLMRQYFFSIPKELEEAAIIDGCSRFRAFWSIIMPNAKPAMATFLIIGFNAEWNAFLWPLIVISDVKKMPIQVGLSYFKGVVSSNWGVLLAGTTMAIVPVIIVFLIFQNYFVRGMVTSGFGGK
jgi:ABC-type sugar transport system, permease component